MSVTVDSGGGLRELHNTGLCPPYCQHTSLGYTTAAIPTEGDLEQEQFTPSIKNGCRDIPLGVVSVWTAQPRTTGAQDSATHSCHPADLQPSSGLQVF